MGESFLITLREGFEAALIIAIVLAAVRRGARPDMARWVWAGTGAALALAVAAGLALHLAVDGLEGVARLRTFAAICAVAAVLLTWMLFWMRAHSRGLAAELRGRVDSAVGRSALALAAVAFVAVAREGLETALFLISSTSAGSSGDVVIGAAAGLVGACALGVLVYHGSRLVSLRLFFQVTGVLVILIAAGLVARAIQFAQAAGDLGTLDGAAYDLTGVHWTTRDSEAGKLLAGIFGWDPRPSIEQLIGYVAFLVPALVVLFWDRPRRAPSPGPVAAGEAAEA